MPTIEEVLKKSGWTDEKIAALDADARGAFGVVLQEASTESAVAREAREKAELAQRATNEMLETQINPALNEWGNREANLNAQLAFLQKQVEGAKAGGFLPADVPGAPPAGTPPRGEGGRYVPGPGGSPVFDEQKFRGEALTVMDQVMRINNDHIRLFGEPIPDDFQSLAVEAGRQRLSIKDFAETKYGFAAKRAEKQAAQQKQRDEKLVADALAEDRKKRAEMGGGNPDTRRAPGSSDFATVTRKVAAGQDGLKDPTTMTAAQRQQQTRQMNHADLAAKDNQPQLVH